MGETQDKYAKTREAAQRVTEKIREERSAKAKERAKDNSPFTNEELAVAERAIDRRVSGGKPEKK